MLRRAAQDELGAQTRKASEEAPVARTSRAADPDQKPWIVQVLFEASQGL